MINCNFNPKDMDALIRQMLHVDLNETEKKLHELLKPNNPENLKKAQSLLEEVAQRLLGSLELKEDIFTMMEKLTTHLEEAYEVFNVRTTYPNDSEKIAKIMKEVRDLVEMYKNNGPRIEVTGVADPMKALRSMMAPIPPVEMELLEQKQVLIDNSVIRDGKVETSQFTVDKVRREILFICYRALGRIALLSSTEEVSSLEVTRKLCNKFQQIWSFFQKSIDEKTLLTVKDDHIDCDFSPINQLIEEISQEFCRLGKDLPPFYFNLGQPT